ncbi:hypothetical protein R75483_06469 [Paraburkholderia domus]|nr:hypothetical protein R75483_06469 [Paraburkholderia domus]
MIVTLDLASDSLVSESILSHQQGIGATPIRHAPHRLAWESGRPSFDGAAASWQPLMSAALVQIGAVVKIFL